MILKYYARQLLFYSNIYKSFIENDILGQLSRKKLITKSNENKEELILQESIPKLKEICLKIRFLFQSEVKDVEILYEYLKYLKYFFEFSLLDDLSPLDEFSIVDTLLQLISIYYQYECSSKCIILSIYILHQIYNKFEYFAKKIILCGSTSRLLTVFQSNNSELSSMCIKFLIDLIETSDEANIEALSSFTFETFNFFQKILLQTHIEYFEKSSAYCIKFLSLICQQKLTDEQLEHFFIIFSDLILCDTNDLLIAYGFYAFQKYSHYHKDKWFKFFLENENVRRRTISSLQSNHYYILEQTLYFITEIYRQKYEIPNFDFTILIELLKYPIDNYEEEISNSPINNVSSLTAKCLSKIANFHCRNVEILIKANILIIINEIFDTINFQMKTNFVLLIISLINGSTSKNIKSFIENKFISLLISILNYDDIKIIIEILLSLEKIFQISYNQNLIFTYNELINEDEFEILNNLYHHNNEKIILILNRIFEIFSLEKSKSKSIFQF